MSSYVYYVCTLAAGRREGNLNQWLKDYCPEHITHSSYRTTYRKIEFPNKNQAMLFQLAWGDVLIERPAVEDWLTPRP